MNAPLRRLKIAMASLALFVFSCTSHGDNSVEAIALCQQLGACLCADAPCSPDTITLGDPHVVAPSPKLPEQAESQTAHNNLDITMFNSRLYFAYRTAPSHFASADARLNIVSTTDHVSWRFEGVFHEGRDLREPRFLVLEETLYLYYARLGADRFAFEPGVARRTIYRGPGDWSEPETVFADGFIPWRFRYRQNEAYMLGYTGGETIYSEAPSELKVQWLRTSDSDSWSPVADGQPVVLTGGVSETDFCFTKNGGIVAVGRNEAGDDGGFGSRICRASSVDIGNWICRDDPRKFDSPLVFPHGERVFLVGRRNVTETGAYDVAENGTLQQRRLINQAEYWQTPKRCALWEVDPEALTVRHVLDLPTGGDTCFASVIPLDEHQYLLYDYRSTGASADIGWLDGQTEPTEIYRITLGIP